MTTIESRTDESRLGLDPAQPRATSASLLAEHVVLSIVPVVAAFVISIPLGFLVFRTGQAANFVLAVFGVIYSIPSLALFVVMPAILGTQILNPVNIAVALTIYSVALLVRSVVDGLRVRPDAVKQSASAVGFGWLRRLARVELPLAMPVIFAGLRVVTVSNIALVSVGAVIGVGALGQLFDQRPQPARSSPRSSSGWCSACCWRWSPTRSSC